MIGIGSRTETRELRLVEFYCARCDMVRIGSLVATERHLDVLFLSMPLRQPGNIVECSMCGTAYPTGVLRVATSSTLSGRIHRAQQYIALAAVAALAGGRDVRSVAARRFLLSRGWEPADIEPILTWACDEHTTGRLFLPDLDWSLNQVAHSMTPRGLTQLVSGYARILTADGVFGVLERSLVQHVGEIAGIEQHRIDTIVERTALRMPKHYA